jgi:hypothetical protein
MPYKKTHHHVGLFVWCTIADVKITLPDDLEADAKEIRKILLLEGSVDDNGSRYQ